MITSHASYTIRDFTPARKCCILDELKKNDPHLRLVAMVLAGGLFILLAGLWWVQVVSSREYQNHLDTQAYRTIRIPAVRGKILDREGRVLAENRPRYNLSLYLDELWKPFADANVATDQTGPRAAKTSDCRAGKKLDRSLTKAERKHFAFTPEQLAAARRAGARTRRRQCRRPNQRQNGRAAGV